MALRLSSYSARLCFTGLALAGLLAGCAGGDDDGEGGGDDQADDGDDGDGDGQAPAGILSRASRSSTIALSDNGAWVAMVNPESGTLSIFQTSDNARIGVAQTGKEPSSVVIGPDNTTAYVANRADGTVVRVRDIDTGSPTVDATVAVGSEPVGLALSPAGTYLYVAEFAESRITAIGASDMEVVTSIDVDRPRAVLVTNDLDEDELDETIVVPEYFGEPVAGGEAKDNGRIGQVRRFALSDLSDSGTIQLSPLDSGFPRAGVEGNPNVQTSPNQLASVALADGRIYVTSVSASPEAPVRFDNNVFPVVYVADLASGQEVKSGGTTNLARKIVDAIPNPSPESPRFIPGDLSDIDFVPGRNGVSYAVGKAGDVMVRVVFADGQVTVGSSQNVEINLAGNDQIGRCQNPIGVAVLDETRAYVNCWVTRRLGVVDLGAQALAATVESAPAPQGEFEESAQRGRRFYFTGRGRWSNDGRNDDAGILGNGSIGGEGWSSCGSCHPDGMTDNVTWVFAAGPRQTTSQDGSFSHGPGQQKQRIFNWTGVFEEHHDFERNTRDVSGGLGAITTADSLDQCNDLALERRVALTVDDGNANTEDPPIGGLAQPLKELADNVEIAICGHKDWDDIDAFVRTVRPPAARRALSAETVQQGRELFVQGGCDRCHGGQGWTVSRRFFDPTAEGNAELADTPFNPADILGLNQLYLPRNQISAEPPVAEDETGPESPGAAIAEVACVLRNVGSFGIPGDDAATAAIEQRPSPDGFLVAEGRAGFNVPSLYGLALGAPFLHHGQAASLEELFTDPSWQLHTNAGNANFSVTLSEGNNLEALISFLWSIDAAQPELSVAELGGESFDLCPL
jgi:YVTN family beta-propeller protein